MSNSMIPLDRHETIESGRAIQEAQNTVMVTGAAATIALLRELLKHLQLPEKSVNVEISINDAVAYQANTQKGKDLELETDSPELSDEQLRYLKEVIELPQSNEPAAASLPLDKNVTITVDGKEVFSLKNGIVQKNLLAPTAEQVPENPTQTAKISTTKPEIDETPVQKAQVEVVEEEVPELKQSGASLSDEQRQELKKLGVDPQTVENTVGQKAQGTVPIIVVLNREIERNVPKSPLKDNLKSALSRFQKAVRDFSRQVSSFLSSSREKLFSSANRGIKQDLQNLAVVNIASKLLDRLGGQTDSGKQVFEGNSFRLERQGKDLSVTALDGRGTILSLKEGELKGSLTQKDVEKFQAVERQLERGQSRQTQAQMG